MYDKGAIMMRVNARFVGAAERQVEYLAKATGQSVSEVLRTSVDRYFQEVRAGQGGLRHFARHVGAYRSGDTDTSTRYKDLLTEDLSAKHGKR